jgi:hypothetical protein
MKEKTVDSMGLKYKILVPETAEEYCTLAKRKEGPDGFGAVVEEAVDNVIYRGPNADFRALVSAELEKEGYARQTKPHPDGKKDPAGNAITVYDETEVKHINRVAAENGKKVSDFQYLADRVNEMKDEQGHPVLTFDPSQRERKTPVAAGPTKQDVANAQALIGAGREKFDKALARVSAITGKTYDNNAAFADVNIAAAVFREYRLELAKADTLLKA